MLKIVTNDVFIKFFRFADLLSVYIGISRQCDEIINCRKGFPSSTEPRRKILNAFGFIAVKHLSGNFPQTRVVVAQQKAVALFQLVRQPKKPRIAFLSRTDLAKNPDLLYHFQFAIALFPSQ